MPLVDAHLHLWDPARFDYPWLAELPQLCRPFGPQDLGTDGHELSAAVFVEAGRVDDHAIVEAQWIGELAEHWPVLQAIVAHAPLERGADVAGHLRQLAALPLVHGVRRNVQDEAPDFAARDSYLAGVRLLAEYDFTADLCIRHHQLPAVTELVARVPQVTFVLDHLGKPDVRAARFEPWREHLSRLAAHPNVVCKLSGLSTEAHWQDWRTEDVLPYLRHALAEFGPERCMFGGDWPVATLATGYGRWVDVVVEALAGRPATERDQVLRGTATRVYRLSAA